MCLCESLSVIVCEREMNMDELMEKISTLIDEKLNERLGSSAKGGEDIWADLCQGKNMFH